MTSYQLWQCLVCGLIYDEALGWSEDNIAPGTRWADVPADWACPDCGVGKEDFELLGPSDGVPTSKVTSQIVVNHTLLFEQPQSRTIASTALPLIIIGSGLAAYHLAIEVRKLDTSRPITLITSDNGDFYNKPMLSTGFSQNQSSDQIRTNTSEEMAKKYQLTIHIHTRVSAIDSSNNTLTLGQHTLAFQDLVLAIGSSCISPPLQGDGLANVYHVNDLIDYHRFRTAMVNKRRVLVIGAGLIGSEYANDLVHAGYQVTVVDPVERVLAALLPLKVSQQVQQKLHDKGVSFCFGAVVEHINNHKNGIVATLSNGKTIAADIVLSAVGVSSRTALASAAGIEVERGIKVDSLLQSSTQRIYALGDCAQVNHQVHCYVEPLLRCARALAKTLTGSPTPVVYDPMPIAIKTTINPVVVCPPPLGAKGKWQYNSDRENIVALFLDRRHKLLGFALTNSARAQRLTLLARVNHDTNEKNNLGQPPAA